MTKPDQSNNRGDSATKRVEASLREALESRLEALPPEVTQRLAASRQAALTRRSRAYWRRPAVGGLALAASVLLAVILIGQGTRETTPGQDVPGQHAAGPVAAEPTATADLLILAIESQDLDDEAATVIQDLDFMLWLRQQDDLDV
jgi:hypothetical protein